MWRTRDRPTIMKMYGITTLTSEGFFSDLYTVISEVGSTYIAPWIWNEHCAHNLDRYYYFVNSGDKLASNIIISQYVEGSGIYVDQRLMIARMFLDVHGQMLNRQWANYVKSYDPLQPYDVTEETDYTHGNVSTVEDDGSVTTERKGKEASVIGSRTDTDHVYGFDSNSPVASDDTQFGEVTNTTTYGGDGTESQQRKDVRTLDTTRTSRDNSTDDLTTHKYGTLGTTSMAEIMSAEIKTWMWNFYLKCLFPAADSMLTIPIY